MMTTNPGYDYGRGTTNVHLKTGFRFGVISPHNVGTAWYERSQGEYGEPRCPNDGSEIGETPDSVKSLENDGEYWCEYCKETFDSDETFPNEALSFEFKDPEYEAAASPEGDIFIVVSPYYTYAQFASPCAPGATYLMNPLWMDPEDFTSKRYDRNRGYCFGHEWFEGDKAPYPVYRVDTNELVEPAGEWSYEDYLK